MTTSPRLPSSWLPATTNCHDLLHKECCNGLLYEHWASAQSLYGALSTVMLCPHFHFPTHQRCKSLVVVASAFKVSLQPICDSFSKSNLFFLNLDEIFLNFTQLDFIEIYNLTEPKEKRAWMSLWVLGWGRKYLLTSKLGINHCPCEICKVMLTTVCLKYARTKSDSLFNFSIQRSSCPWHL